MPDIIKELTHAYLRAYLNEVSLDQKGVNNTPEWDDPVKLRFGAWHPADRPNFYIAAISMDVLSGDNNEPHRHEVGFIAFKLDPDPTIEVFLQDSASTDQDATMRRRLRLTSAGLEFDVPVKFNVGTNVGGEGDSHPPNELRHPNGIHWLVIQDDSNFVAYANTVPFDYSTGVPTFASSDIYARLAALEQKVGEA